MTIFIGRGPPSQQLRPEIPFRIHVGYEPPSRPRHIAAAACKKAAAARVREAFVSIASGEGTFAKMIDVGRALRDEDGARAIVMGCAGMARHGRSLEQALGIPVIDPTQAAVTMAPGTVQFSRH
jgi:Asp/Glu/hydantoin racemase